MKRLVDGVEIDLDPTAADVRATGDRLLVRTAEGTRSAVAVRVGDKVLISYLGRVFTLERAGGRRHSGGVAVTGEARAPMPGQIVDVLVEIGAQVDAGDKLLVLEAMKTQQPILAPFAGSIAKLPVEVGRQVAEGDLLVEVCPLEEEKS